MSTPMIQTLHHLHLMVKNDDERGENGLYSLLARWAIENGITHIALGELLGVLILCTLIYLKTPEPFYQQQKLMTLNQ